MEIEGFHEIKEFSDYVRGRKYKVGVRTTVDPAHFEALRTTLDTDCIPHYLIKPSMVDWPEVQAVHDAVKKLAKRIIQEIE